ncbi:MAG: c-type cytochrome [Gammaproteobacteria bacterium]|nr:c-type cytochrome [Gammaproteobacteria bacterium]
MATKISLISLIVTLMLFVDGAWAGGDVERGAELAADCSDCHGEDGKGDEEIPAIAGMDAAKLAKLLADFKSGAVESDMVDFVGAISEQDMADIAAYYASLPH